MRVALFQLGTLVVLAAVAVVGIIVADRTSDGEGETVTLTPGGSVCISGTHGLAGVASEAESVRHAYASSRHQRVDVVVGCPPTSLFEHDAPRSSADLEFLLEDSAQVVRQVGDLSPYVAFVYVVPADVYGEYFGSAPYVRAVAQFICSGDNCGADGSSFYLPSGVDERTVQAAIGGE